LHRLTITLRGLWWRRGLTLAVLIVAAITTAAAALGPLYARAAAESTLHDQLTAAPVAAAGLHYAVTDDVSTTLSLQRVLDDAPHAGTISGYPRRIFGIYAPTKATGPNGTVRTGALWRQNICQHLVITAGRCPTRPGQVLVSQRSTGPVYGWQVGRTINLPALQVQALNAKGFPIGVPARLTIVGTYRPIDSADPYWFGQNYFDALAATNGPDTVDAVIVSRSEFTSLAPPMNAEVDVDLPLDVNAVHWSEVPSLTRGVAALENRYFAFAQNPVSTRVGSVIAAARHQRSLVDVGTTLVTLQLGLLAWLVLFQVVSDAAEARGNEIALSKVRGRGSLATLRFGLGEPLLLLLLALPLGLLLALAATHVFARAVLAPHIPIAMPAGAILAAFAAFAGGMVAALIAAARTLHRPVLEQWRRTAIRPRGNVVAIVVDVLIAAVAVAALVELRAHHRTAASNGSVSLLAPGLLVTAVALLGVRLLPPLCRALSVPTRAGRRLGVFLGVRQVGRQTAGLRLATLLAIALGLASFAVAGESVAHANRVARARAELGADRIVSIQYDPSHNPVDAVHRADPSGRWAMAAATWLPDGGDSVTGTVLGVDSGRFAQVAYPAAGGPSLQAIASTVAASEVPAVNVRSPFVRVRIRTSDLVARPAPTVQLNLSTRSRALLQVDAGTLREGTHDYTARVPCAVGCVFGGITWNRSPLAASNQHGSVTVQAIELGGPRSWTRVSLQLSHPSSWRPAVPQGQASDHIRLAPDGVHDEFSNENGGYGGVVYAYAPSPLPAFATPRAVIVGPGAPDPSEMVDETGTAASFKVRRYGAVLPTVLDNGLIVDVRYLAAELPAFGGEANWQVWLGPHAPSDALARLRAAGLIVQGARTEHERVITLGRQGPALALLLLLACAIAGAALAVGGTAISVSASSRRRSYEFAALRAVGVDRRALVSAGIIEQLLMLGTAVVLGIPAGLFAARLAMPAIPEFADTTPVALRYTTPAWPVVLFTGAFVLLLLGTAVVAARALVRVAVPARLREDEQ
jgi:hypothetical protein